MGETSKLKYDAAKKIVNELEAGVNSLVSTKASLEQVYREIHALSKGTGPNNGQMLAAKVAEMDRLETELKRQLSLVAYASGGARTAVLDYGEYLGRKTEKYKSLTDVLKKKTLAEHQANYIELSPKLYNLVEKLQPIVAYAKTLPEG